ncbi:MAG TPA: hypothetical protein VK566_00350, partial [Nitrososphaeraceae archaeon]|nr:hypothetical protein [Nitrososphaeraceae archaeon]
FGIRTLHVVGSLFLALVLCFPYYRLAYYLDSLVPTVNGLIIATPAIKDKTMPTIRAMTMTVM